MPRNSSGAYSLPELPFVPGTIIESDPVNQNFSDIATALTQSLAINGVSSMTGPFFAANGSETAPSIAFSNSVGTGWYRVSDNVIGLSIAGVQALRIDTNRILNCVVGITLGNTDVSDVDLLDWYEEGTFTPALNFGGNSVGLTYSSRSGQYTRIGNVLYYNLYIEVSDIGSSVGDAFISGLPFEPTNAYNPASVEISNWTQPSQNAIPIARGTPFETEGEIELLYSHDGSTVRFDNTNANNGMYIAIAGFYRVAS